MGKIHIGLQWSNFVWPALLVCGLHCFHAPWLYAFRIVDCHMLQSWSQTFLQHKEPILGTSIISIGILTFGCHRFLFFDASRKWTHYCGSNPFGNLSLFWSILFFLITIFQQGLFHIVAPVLLFMYLRRMKRQSGRPKKKTWIFFLLTE